ncbi:hypothetical protein C8R45DRAFT_1114868 [Mycena sanguinolenta]|nr:hypothetical protein C8R45DRAFT_1114868 [Mycena sanguinolenta]
MDPDEPNRTWSAAKEQMLLLYGSMDKDRRVCERNLVEFCCKRSATSPFRTKQEIEKYLRDFQLIAALLVKQKDIMIAQWDFYFVSGIPTVIKTWFISRVPEPRRTRSNPVSLADSLGILYGQFDPEALFPDLWSDIDDVNELSALISTSYTSSTHAPSIPSSLLNLAPLCPSSLPQAPPLPSPLESSAATDSFLDLTAPLRLVPSSEPISAPPLAIDALKSPVIKPTSAYLNCEFNLHGDLAVDIKPEVLSDNLLQDSAKKDLAFSVKPVPSEFKALQS